jgi:hypothetical protein
MSDILLIAAAIAAGSVSVVLLLMWIMRVSEKRGRFRHGGDGGLWSGDGSSWSGDGGSWSGDGGGDCGVGDGGAGCGGGDGGGGGD